MDREIAPEVRRRRDLKKVAGIVIAIAAIGFFLAATMQWLRPSVKRSEIETARVERGDIDATLQASGTVTCETALPITVGAWSPKAAAR